METLMQQIEEQYDTKNPKSSKSSKKSKDEETKPKKKVDLKVSIK